jgi:CRP-like cAMP-binding protein
VIAEQVQPGAVLLAPGEAPQRLTVIRSGRARVLSGSGEHQHAVADLVPGDTCGEAALVSGQEGAPALTLKADTAMELYHIDRAALDHLLAFIRRPVRPLSSR